MPSNHPQDSIPRSQQPSLNSIISDLKSQTQIQSRYTLHRTNRNAQQRAKLLSPDFAGVTPDEILAKLEKPEEYPGYEDPRHCLVFWARPTMAVRELIGEVQRRLREAAPSEFSSCFVSILMDVGSSGLLLVSFSLPSTH
jgi:hypothetical protein